MQIEFRIFSRNCACNVSEKLVTATVGFFFTPVPGSVTGGGSVAGGNFRIFFGAGGASPGEAESLDGGELPGEAESLDGGEPPGEAESLGEGEPPGEAEPLDG